MSIDQLPVLYFHLLGAPQIKCESLPSPQQLPTKAQAMLYYLAMTGRTHTRAALADLLWGEHGEEEARRNLRKVIQQLREHLDPYLAIDYHTVGFRSPQVYWVDAVAFAAPIPDTQVADPDRLQQLLALYYADFLEGFYVRDAPTFETWLVAERARLRELMIGRLSALAGQHAGQGDLPLAIACTRRLLELEPWREEAHRQLMTWLAQSGQRNAALVQYELCCRALAEELAVEPDAATRALHAHLLQPAVVAPRPLPTPPVTTVDYRLVGREGPWQTLRSTWAKAVQSGTHMVSIGGEAGIGKTRLAEELLLHVQRQGHAAARARAYALEGRLAYAPLADLLHTPPLQARLARLDRVWLSEVARLLPDLLIQHRDLPAPEPLTERWQQQRLFEALRHAFTAEPHPLVLLLDDLQWCDPETLAWLQYLIDTAPQAPLLVVGTVRSDEIGKDHALHKLRRVLQAAGKLTTIDLVPLSAADTAALGGQVCEYPLDGEATQSLYAATAGNPLFILETVRAGNPASNSVQARFGPRDQPTLPQPSAGVPPKVYAVIESRLAQLSSPARILAQVGATIGRAFTLPLLIAATGTNEETAVAGLDELWQRRIVVEQGSEQGGARYDFTHDRIRDVAYAENSPVRRAHLHRRVAEALENLHATDLDPFAGELGMHYQRAGAWKVAFPYYRRAAAVASRLYAHSEEVDYLQKAIAAAEMLAADTATTAVALDLWYDLGLAQAFVHGLGSELAESAWRKADELAAQAGHLANRCRALSWLVIIAQNRGEWYKARDLNRLALALAQEIGDASLVDSISADYGITLYHFGETAQALAAFRRHPGYVAGPEQLALSWARSDFHSGSLLRLAKSLWLLGYADQAHAYVRALLARRHLRTDLVARCASLTFAAMFYSFLRDAPAVQRLSEELITVSVECDFLFFTTEGRVLRGWALAQQGAITEGLALLRDGVDDQRRRGIRMFEPYCRSLLGEALALAGESEEALDEVMEAVTYADECGSRYWNAHILKLQGDFQQALALPDAEVEASYQHAIATARRQEAKALELRVTTSLCRLRQHQGKQVEARRQLSAIYSWFTEGFDTVDLQEARALLDELAIATHTPTPDAAHTALPAPAPHPPSDAASRPQ